jgi:hypothetical protein
MNIRALSTVGLLALVTSASTLPVLAQDGPGPAGPPGVAPVADPNGVPGYMKWQNDWDNNQYDRRHVILGTVADFKPFRLQVSRHDGPTQTIDLKQGTTILPNGMTPMPNQRVAVVGYYSNGTFVANRVILHE